MSRANFSKIADQIEKDGFDRGYRQAIKDVRRALGGALDDILKAQGGPEQQSNDRQPDFVFLDKDRPGVTIVEAKVAGGVPKQARKQSAEDRVYEIINAIPGLRGAMIVKALEDTGDPVKERTVRTSLWRLKNRKLIELRGNEWYVTAFAKEWRIPPKEESLPPQ